MNLVIFWINDSFIIPTELKTVRCFNNRGLTQLHESYTPRANAEINEVIYNEDDYCDDALRFATHWSCTSKAVFIKEVS